MFGEMWYDVNNSFISCRLDLQNDIASHLREQSFPGELCQPIIIKIPSENKNYIIFKIENSALRLSAYFTVGWNFISSSIMVIEKMDFKFLDLIISMRQIEVKFRIHSANEEWLLKRDNKISKYSLLGQLFGGLKSYSRCLPNVGAMKVCFYQFRGGKGVNQVKVVNFTRKGRHKS